MTNAVIILAGGRGTRFSNSFNKSMLVVSGKALWEHVLDSYLRHPKIDHAVIVANVDILPVVTKKIAARNDCHPDKVKITTGGESRQLSVQKGLLSLDANSTSTVFIHEAARPLVYHDLIDECLKKQRQFDGVLPIQKSRDGLLTIDNEGIVKGFQDRDQVVSGVGPEVLDYKKGVLAFTEAARKCWEFPESCSLLASLGYTIGTILTTYPSLKVTHPVDACMIEKLMEVDDV